VRDYAEFGTLNPYVKAVCKYAFKVQLEYCKEEEAKEVL
jgi:hypothetical protein